MYVSHLSLVDFRSYETVDVELGPGVNALVGPNGQGKTNLVEAIGYVATLASHRVAGDVAMVRAGAQFTSTASGPSGSTAPTASPRGSPESSREEFNDLLAKLAAEDVFKGKKGQAYFVRATDDATPNLLFVGLGKAAEATGETFRIAGAVVAKRLEGEKVKAAALDLASFLEKGLEISAEKAALGLAQGALFSQYSFDLYKSEKAKPAPGDTLL